MYILLIKMKWGISDIILTNQIKTIYLKIQVCKFFKKFTGFPIVCSSCFRFIRKITEMYTVTPPLPSPPTLPSLFRFLGIFELGLGSVVVIMSVLEEKR